MSKQKKNSRRHSRIRFPFPALNIGNIIFGALFFYMAVSLFFYLTADHIKSFQVVQGTLSRNDTYTAFAMRTESVQLSSGSGYATADVVLPGETIAKEYGSGTHTLSVKM